MLVRFDSPNPRNPIIEKKDKKKAAVAKETISLLNKKPPRPRFRPIEPNRVKLSQQIRQIFADSDEDQRQKSA